MPGHLTLMYNVKSLFISGEILQNGSVKFLRDSQAAFLCIIKSSLTGGAGVWRFHWGSDGRNNVFIHYFMFIWELENVSSYRKLEESIRSVYLINKLCVVWLSAYFFCAWDWRFTLASQSHDMPAFTPQMNLFFKTSLRHMQFVAQGQREIISSDPEQDYFFFLVI